MSQRSSQGLKSPRKSDEKRRSSSAVRSQGGQSSAEDSDALGFDEIFDCFCKIGDREADEIALRNVDKWFKQANLFTHNFTSTDTAIAFSKIGMNKKKLTKDEFFQMLEQLAEEKGMAVEEFKSKLEAAGRPQFEHVTKPIRGSIAAENMERLTNPRKFTGTHRERFDSEGRGLGLAGRYDIANVDGYVQGYKNKDTYGGEEEEEESSDKPHGSGQ